MFNNYLKVALRNLRKQKLYSFINVFGLALSMSVCLLIILLVMDQRSYDRFNPKADRTYRVVANRTRPDGRERMLAATPAALAPAIARDVPAVEETTRLGQIRTNAIYTGKSLRVTGLFAEPSFFDVFGFKLLAGDPQDALSGPGKVILSENAARRIFGDTDPMGATLTLEGNGDFIVSGIVSTDHVKSHLIFDVLASFTSLEATESGRDLLGEEINFWSFANYVVLKKGASTDGLRQYLDQASSRYHQEGGDAFDLKLQPLTGITLGPLMSNEISAFTLPLVVVLLLGAIGIVVLLTAGFNYIGLSVARSLQRAREVGVRKVVGAHRRQVIGQFIAESVLMALAAFLLALSLLSWLLPGFNNLSIMQHLKVELAPTSLLDPHVLAVFITFTLLIGLIAGLYPAAYLSRFDPVVVLKGAGLGRGHARLRLRKVLVTAQLVFSLIFVTSAVLVFRQFDYMVNFDYGFRTADLINVDLQGVPYATFRDELSRDPGIMEIAAVWEPPASGSNNGSSVARPGKDTLAFTFYSVDSHFLSSLDLKLLAGSNFTGESSRDQVIVNETAAERLGFSSPGEAVGQELYFGPAPGPVTITGVVEDYHFKLASKTIEPMLLYRDPESFRRAMVRVMPGQMPEVTARLESTWKRIDPVHPVEFVIYDDQIRTDNEVIGLFRDMEKIVGFASLIALAISCLGLLAMAAFTTQLRAKEVGIRKVLGATVPSVVWLLSREFLTLIPVAVAIAIPVAWFGNNLWLEQLAHVTFGPAIVLGGITLLAALALLAVGTQAVRAALADPIKSLRYE